MRSVWFASLSLALVSGIFSLAASASQQVDQPPCADNFEVFENTQVQTLPSENVCFVSVHPLLNDGLLYRDFLFDSDGLMMIFDSYGDGPDSQTTAARNYYFFPRTQTLKYAFEAATHELKVTMPSGKIVTFNTLKTIMTGISGAQVSFDYTIDPAVRGGVEITSNDGLFLDGGFKRGESPSQNPKNKIVFKDQSQNSCEVANGDVYKYTPEDDAIFKFSDRGLLDFLATRCPLLKPSIIPSTLE